jgi:hypothetical protein
VVTSVAEHYREGLDLQAATRSGRPLPLLYFQESRQRSRVAAGAKYSVNLLNYRGTKGLVPRLAEAYTDLTVDNSGDKWGQMGITSDRRGRCF